LTAVKAGLTNCRLGAKKKGFETGRGQPIGKNRLKGGEGRGISVVQCCGFGGGEPKRWLGLGKSREERLHMRGEEATAIVP